MIKRSTRGFWLCLAAFVGVVVMHFVGSIFLSMWCDTHDWTYDHGWHPETMSLLIFYEFPCSQFDYFNNLSGSFAFVPLALNALLWGVAVAAPLNTFFWLAELVQRPRSAGRGFEIVQPQRSDEGRGE
jgi:hypothetical protein